MKRLLKLNATQLHALIVSVILHLALFVLIGGIIIFEAPMLRQAMLVDGVTLISQDLSEDDVLQDIEIEAPMLESLQETEEPIGTVSGPKITEITISNIILNQELIPTDYPIPVPVGTMQAMTELSSRSTRPSVESTNITKALTKKIEINNVFGSDAPSNAMLTGTFYDLKQSNSKELFPDEMRLLQEPSQSARRQLNLAYIDTINKFIDTWNPSIFEKYYKSPITLSTPHIYMPPIHADEAPKAFKVDHEVASQRWVIHYQGNIIAPFTGKFRFVGVADDVLVVRLNNKNVLNASIVGNFLKYWLEKYPNQTPIGEFGKHRRSYQASDWLEIEKGQSYPIEILLGEMPGMGFRAFLMIQQENVTYAEGSHGLPLLPLFRTSHAASPELKDTPHVPRVLLKGPVFGE